MSVICQKTLPEDMRQARALPGVQPLEMTRWLHVDDAFGAQMARRAELLHERSSEVLHAGAELAGSELLELVLHHLHAREDFLVSAGQVRRPDGVVIPLEGDPLWILGHLVQEDLCILDKEQGSHEHVLKAAVLCFPASWRLADKVGRALTGIHDPVPEYSADLAKRVQRLFDGIKPERPLWRFNRLWYHDPALFQPVSGEKDRTGDERAAQGGYLRTERQSLLRLPKSGAVVFSIHTYVLARADVEPT